MPSFLYTVSGVSIEDRFEGVENGLSRRVLWHSGSPEPFISHPDEVRVQEEPTSKPGQRLFTYFWK